MASILLLVFAALMILAGCGDPPEVLAPKPQAADTTTVGKLEIVPDELQLLQNSAGKVTVFYVTKTRLDVTAECDWYSSSPSIKVTQEGTVTVGTDTGRFSLTATWETMSVKATVWVYKPTPIPSGFGEIGFSTSPIYAGFELFDASGKKIDTGGKATPAVIRVPVGSYSYIFWLKDYQPVAGTVEVRDGQLAQAQQYLQPAPGSKGYVVFTSSPGYAGVQLYGNNGEVTPQQNATPLILEQDAGPYAYIMHLKGYESAQGGYTIEVGRTAFVHAYLQALPSGFGEIGFASTPIYAGIELFDATGKKVDTGGKATPNVIQVPVGSYSYILWLKGYVPASGTVEVRDGQLSQVQQYMQPAPSSHKNVWIGDAYVTAKEQRTEIAMLDLSGTVYVNLGYGPEEQQAEHCEFELYRDGQSPICSGILADPGVDGIKRWKIFSNIPAAKYQVVMQWRGASPPLNSGHCY